MTVKSSASASSPSVSVVMPAMNEASNLPHVFALLPPDLHELIVVDGHSNDNTIEVALSLRPTARIVKQTRVVKGNALACGFHAATGDVIAMVDADGSADPGEIPRFVEALVDGADFAKGTRFAPGGGSADITRLRKLGNRGLSQLVNHLYGTDYTDLCYGFNVFWRRHVPVLGLDSTSPSPVDGDGRIWGDGFEVETLIHVRAASAGLRVAEVPSFEHPRLHGVTNLKAPRDGARVLRTILSERQRARTGETERLQGPASPTVLGDVMPTYVSNVPQLDCAELRREAFLLRSEIGVGAHPEFAARGKEIQAP